MYPFLLYTPNAFVTRWREWYIETGNGHHDAPVAGHLVHPEHHQRGDDQALPDEPEAGRGIVSNWDGAWEEKEEDTVETPKDKFYAMFSELDESEFERFLADNPEYLENGYDEINIDLIGEPSQTHYDTGLKTKQGDTVLAVNAAHGILIVEQTGEDTLGMEYAGKVALCKKPENIYVGTSEGLGDYGSFVSDMVRDYDAILGINASGFADFDGNGTGGTVYGFLKSQGEKYQDAVGNGWKIIGFDNEDHLQVGAFNDTPVCATRWSSTRRSSSTARIWSQVPA